MGSWTDFSLSKSEWFIGAIVVLVLGFIFVYIILLKRYFSITRNTSKKNSSALEYGIKNDSTQNINVMEGLPHQEDNISVRNKYKPLKFTPNLKYLEGTTSRSPKEFSIEESDGSIQRSQSAFSRSAEPTDSKNQNDFNAPRAQPGSQSPSLSPLQIPQRDTLLNQRLTIRSMSPLKYLLKHFPNGSDAKNDDAMSHCGYGKRRESFFSSGTMTMSDQGTIDKLWIITKNFKPLIGDELKLKKGQVVTISDVYEDGWAKGTIYKTSITGIFPLSIARNYN